MAQTRLTPACRHRQAHKVHHWTRRTYLCLLFIDEAQEIPEEALRGRHVFSSHCGRMWGKKRRENHRLHHVPPLHASQPIEGTSSHAHIQCQSDQKPLAGVGAGKAGPRAAYTLHVSASTLLRVPTLALSLCHRPSRQLSIKTRTQGLRPRRIKANLYLQVYFEPVFPVR